MHQLWFSLAVGVVIVGGVSMVVLDREWEWALIVGALSMIPACAIAVRVMAGRWASNVELTPMLGMRRTTRQSHHKW